MQWSCNVDGYPGARRSTLKRLINGNLKNQLLENTFVPLIKRRKHLDGLKIRRSRMIEAAGGSTRAGIGGLSLAPGATQARLASEDYMVSSVS